MFLEPEDTLLMVCDKYPGAFWVMLVWALVELRGTLKPEDTFSMGCNKYPDAFWVMLVWALVELRGTIALAIISVSYQSKYIIVK